MRKRALASPSHRKAAEKGGRITDSAIAVQEAQSIV